MIEITFREEYRGSLSHAQSYGIGEYPGGYSFITYYNEDGSIMTPSEAKAAEEEAEKAEKARWEAAKPLGGNPEDVFNFDMTLNVGHISKLNCLEQRIQSISEFPADHPDFNLGEFEKNAQQRIILQMEALALRVKKGEPARIWYGDIANERCGMMWLLWSFAKADVPVGNIALVNLPEHLSKKPGDWHKYIAMQKYLSPEEADKICHAWEKLMAENSLLRAVVDGDVISVPEDFYDTYIIEEAKKMKGTFRESWLIGSVCEKVPEIPQYWLLSRTDKLIDENVIAVTEEAGGWPRSFRYLKVI